MDAGRPTLSGPGCTGCGANRNDFGRVSEAIEHERGREREYVQHRLNTRYLCTRKERRNFEDVDTDIDAQNIIIYVQRKDHRDVTTEHRKEKQNKYGLQYAQSMVTVFR